MNLSCRSGAENFIGQLRSFAGAALQRGERSKCSCGPVLGRYLAANNIPRMLGAPVEISAKVNGAIPILGTCPSEKTVANHC